MDSITIIPITTYTEVGLVDILTRIYFHHPGGRVRRHQSMGVRDGGEEDWGMGLFDDVGGPTLEIKRGDTRHAILATLYDSKGIPLDLSKAQSVRFVVGDLSKKPIINREAYIADAKGGSVWGLWIPGDTDVAGEYQIEFKVTHLDGKKETFPRQGFISLRIWEDLR